MRARAPWPFSVPAAPGTGHPNLPTDAGRALGRELARLCDAAEAADLARFPDQRPRCEDCAFRAGTVPNGCAETLMDAIKCMVEVKPFYCHKGVREGQAPKRLCGGWMAMISDGGTR